MSNAASENIATFDMPPRMALKRSSRPLSVIRTLVVDIVIPFIQLLEPTSANEKHSGRNGCKHNRTAATASFSPAEISNCYVFRNSRQKSNIAAWVSGAKMSGLMPAHTR